MLPIGGNEGNASSYAQDFIKIIAESTDSVKLDSCKFCHTEEAKTNVSEKVEKDGYCIVPIENCTNPYYRQKSKFICPNKANLFIIVVSTARKNQYTHARGEHIIRCPYRCLSAVLLPIIWQHSITIDFALNDCYSIQLVFA